MAKKEMIDEIEVVEIERPTRQKGKLIKSVCKWFDDHPTIVTVCKVAGTFVVTTVVVVASAIGGFYLGVNSNDVCGVDNIDEADDTEIEVGEF